MYMYVGRLQTARVEGMMHIGETEEWENWKLFYIDHVTLYRIKFNRLKKKTKKKKKTPFCVCTDRFVSDLFRNHIVGFPTRWLIYLEKTC